MRSEVVSYGVVKLDILFNLFVHVASVSIAILSSFLPPVQYNLEGYCVKSQVAGKGKEETNELRLKSCAKKRRVCNLICFCRPSATPGHCRRPEGLHRP